MNIEKTMYDKLTTFVKERYPKGWGGAAIMHTEQGSFLISVALESANAGASLCMETGAMCEAQKLNERITHSLCIARDDEDSDFRILSPCGICQERLLYWGSKVLVGVTNPNNILIFKSLKEISLHNWTEAYNLDELESYDNVNIESK